jgi:hypothetical protein
MDWRMDLLPTYTNHSELQAITALSLISTNYTLSFFQPASVFNGRFLTTVDNIGDSSVSRAQVLLTRFQ